MNTNDNQMTVIEICKHINRFGSITQKCINTIQNHEQTIKNVIQLIQIMRQLQHVQREDSTEDDALNKPVLFLN